ncbi:hypothetical protein L226DRAFT_573648 [Lentinus tigrinus ALCF2SS1-7]|uniref:uncharacterized protein n=1 Tax=Lentinus tigrinus ALCF2SS1-7 TaxID=1328758 RepID=UPI0011663A62|nr:hypothetical protein L226DRAFT_573648 [Lentinus tigrinus ALCF2SS1-7]
MSSSSFPLDTAELVALYMQAIFYGMGVVTVSYGLRVLMWNREGHFKGKDSVNWIMVGATLAMFTIATMEIAFGFQHDLDAFINYKGPGGPIAEFSKISNWVNVMKTVDYAAQTFIGDAIMVYRCYVIYERNWMVVAVPVILWLAESGDMRLERLVPFITTVLSLTLAMTTMTTGMIVYRILKINSAWSSQRVTRIGNYRLTRIVRILIESGLIYTICVIVFFCTFLASNNSQYPVSDVTVQIIPISFTLILIRVDQGVAVENPSAQLTTISKPITFTLRPTSGDAGPDVSLASPVSRSHFPVNHSDGYMMDDMNSDRDAWKKADHFDAIP